MIKELEDQLGFRLFDRTTRSVSLTAAGAKLLPVVSRSVQDIGEMVAGLARDEDQAQHFLTVAATPLVCGSILPRVIRGLRHSHPQVCVLVKDSERPHIQALVESAEADLGLAILLKQAPGVQRTSLCQLSLACIAPTDTGVPARGARRRSIRWSELCDKPLIALPPGNTLQQLIDSHLDHIGRANESRMTFNNLLTMVAMVEAGLGYAVLPSFVLEACERYQVELLDLVEPQVSIDLYAITRRGAALPAAGDLFLEAFTRHMAHLDAASP